MTKTPTPIYIEEGAESHPRFNEAMQALREAGFEPRSTLTRGPASSLPTPSADEKVTHPLYCASHSGLPCNCRLGEQPLYGTAPAMAVVDMVREAKAGDFTGTLHGLAETEGTFTVAHFLKQHLAEISAQREELARAIDDRAKRDERDRGTLYRLTITASALNKAIDVLNAYDAAQPKPPEA